MRFTHQDRDQEAAEPDAVVGDLLDQHGPAAIQTASFLLADQSQIEPVVGVAVQRVAQALLRNDGTLLAPRLLLMSAVRRAVDEVVGVPSSEEMGIGFDPDPFAEGLEEHPVAQAWLWLSEADQLLLWTVDLEGCSYESLAEQLDTGVRPTRARVKDARRALKRGVAMRAPGRISGDSAVTEVRAGRCREALAQVIGPLVLGEGQVAPWISVRPDRLPLPVLNPVAVGGSALVVLLVALGGLGLAVRMGEPQRPQTANIDFTSPEAVPPAVLAFTPSEIN
ncbi:MAG: sigma-70 family RNA polymerase sigma factor [Actinomycetia bacterium]|nr:sigma-70 family RNA polymerase sigma factor [Actinomycetes bacterium]